MLTCDAFGVSAPDLEARSGRRPMYHFLSGYTAKVAGTEKGRHRAGSNFLDLLRPSLPARAHASEYGNLLRETHRQASRRLLAGEHRLDRRGARASAAACRSASQRAACSRPPLDGFAEQGRLPHRPLFRSGRADLGSRASEPHILNPVKTWASKAEFAATAKHLVENVCEELRHLREACRRQGPRCGPRLRRSPPNKFRRSSIELKKRRLTGPPFFLSALRLRSIEPQGVGQELAAEDAFPTAASPSCDMTGPSLNIGQGAVARGPEHEIEGSRVEEEGAESRLPA